MLGTASEQTERSRYRKMSRRWKETHVDKNSDLSKLFPEIRPSEERRFQQAYSDDDIVRKKANEFVQADFKYAYWENDPYALCIRYLKEKYLKAVTANVKMSAHTLGLLTMKISDTHKEVSKLISTVTTAAEEYNLWLAKRTVEWFQPPFVLFDEDDEEYSIMPRDAKTVSEFVDMLTKAGLPENISRSAGDCVNEGVGFKALWAFVSTLGSWFLSPPIPVNTAGLNVAKMGGWGVK